MARGNIHCLVNSLFFFNPTPPPHPKLHNRNTTPSSEEDITTDIKERPSPSNRPPTETSESPLLTSPVSHLWTDKDGCAPLVQPSHATSTGIFSNLALIMLIFLTTIRLHVHGHRNVIILVST